ncbi:MAG: hypothetical protein ABGZ17_13065 [Planctomycetaceae bacterium]
MPQHDETLLSNPPLTQAAQHVENNHQHLENNDLCILGRSLAELRSDARTTLVSLAHDYTEQLLNHPITTGNTDRIIVSGHQPTLFHPGVWIKNFALGHLSNRTGGIGLNLVVDNDNLTSSSIQVPVGTRDRPLRRPIPYDDDREAKPWEDARLRNPRLFDTFADRVATAMRDWESDPLLSEMWPIATSYRQHSQSLRDCLTAVRHTTERSWGLQNLELPLSWVCQSTPFLWFAAGILIDLPRFLETHNNVLQEFRRVNRIRSQTHPVPELATKAQWLEAPFWIWRQGQTQRKRLLIGRRASELILSDGEQEIGRLPLTTTASNDGHDAVDALQNMQQSGVRFRTRALTTTLFSRLCLSDLFIHGIGGAKYDQMTDQIISRFYGIRPPSFHTITATLHMDFARPYDVTQHDLRRCQSRLRDIQFNPDRHLASQHQSAAQSLIEEKRELIRQQRACRQARISGQSVRVPSTGYHRLLRFREISRQLAGFAQDQCGLWNQERRTLIAQLQANDVILNREYAFCLYSRQKLKNLMQSLPDCNGL